MRNSIFLILLAVSVVACSEISAKYEETFIEYFTEITNESLQPTYLFVIPENVCHACLDKIYDIVEHTDKQIDITIVIVGATDTDMRVISQKLPKVRFYSDKKSLFCNLKNQEITSTVPVFLKFTNRKISKRITFEIDDLSIKLSQLRGELE